MSGTVKIVKLVSGEELMGTYTEGSIQKPGVIFRAEEGGINFETYIAYGLTDTITLHQGAVVWTIEPDEELLEKYLELISNL